MNDELSEITPQVRNYRALIVFTNQRTGSSNLTNWFLQEHRKYIDYDGLYQTVKKLGYKVDEQSMHQYEILDAWHGPFKDVFQIYRKEKKKDSKNALKKVEVFIKTLMSYRPTFKIMTEYTPIEICSLVIKYLNYYHYSALLLYRRKAFERCRSLHFSLSTDIYSPLHFPDVKNKVKKLNNNEFNLDLDSTKINNLFEIQKRVNEKNIEVWNLLKTAGCRYASVSYEDIYGSLNDSTILHMTFRWLFYTIWDFQPLKETGKVGADKYYNVKGIDVLKAELTKLDNPTFSNLHVEV